MANLTGRHISLFLVDGVPDGTLTAEIMNWTGHVLYAPRSRIVEIVKRSEVQRTGVYLLIGEDPEDADETLVYVGQGDDVGARLAAHNRDPEKAFWNFVCIITSKDLNLTAAHVRYLESRIISLISREGRARLANKNEPAFDRLPEADSSDMEDFVARLLVLLPVLGIQFIRPTPKLDKPAVDAGDLASQSIPLDASTSRASTVRERPTADGERSPVFKFNSASVNARAVEIGGQMIVLKGSQAQSQEQPSLGSSIRTYREQLKRSGKLIPGRNGILEFVDDVAFTSPSAAAQAVMGTSRNGRIDWIVENTGEPYARWQEAEISKAQQECSPEANSISTA
jgi:hypothetical protein